MEGFILLTRETGLLELVAATLTNSSKLSINYTERNKNGQSNGKTSWN